MILLWLILAARPLPEQREATSQVQGLHFRMQIGIRRSPMAGNTTGKAGGS